LIDRNSTASPLELETGEFYEGVFFQILDIDVGRLRISFAGCRRTAHAVLMASRHFVF
jgi:hypothetical protein